jgi:hypothetical protein
MVAPFQRVEPKLRRTAKSPELQVCSCYGFPSASNPASASIHGPPQQTRNDGGSNEQREHGYPNQNDTKEEKEHRYRDDGNQQRQEHDAERPQSKCVNAVGPMHVISKPVRAPY